MPNDHDIWQWQEPGSAWKGVGIYHVTLTVPSREPLLGKFVIPNNDPIHAYVERTELGNSRSMPDGASWGSVLLFATNSLTLLKEQPF